MYLIIAEQSDVAAHWLVAELTRSVAMPVRWVSPAQLVYAPSIEHRMVTGHVQSRFRLWSGDQLEFTKVRGVINRITAVPLDHLAGADPVERDYASGELHAFLLGWLASLDCPVLNPPAPVWLSGEFHDDMCAAHLAVQAGMSCAAVQLDLTAAMPPPSTDAGDVHFVVDGQVIGPVLSRSNVDALISFATLWGARLLQVETQADGAKRRYLRATSLPDYRFGGASLVRAIAKALGA